MWCKKYPDMANNLITYRQAADIFKARKIGRTTRTVRNHVWANPSICPVYSDSYHGKRMKLRDVERLCAFILKKHPNKGKFARKHKR